MARRHTLHAVLKEVPGAKFKGFRIQVQLYTKELRALSLTSPSIA